jgi:hypothetical protein
MAPIWLLPLLLELDTLQVTAVLVLPVTVAVNCSVAPYPTVWLVGEMATLTLEEGGFDELLLLPPPHPAAASARRIAAPSAHHPTYLIASP